MYEVLLPTTGDRAEAPDLGGALLAAKCLTDEAAPWEGGSRLHRAEVLVLLDGQYCGGATTMARSGRNYDADALSVGGRRLA